MSLWRTNTQQDPSIAVIPFVNRSGDSAQTYLSDGLAEDLTARLARNGIWRMTDGRIVGRWPTASMLAAFSVLADPVDKTAFLCGDSGSYLAFKPQLCGSADIMTTPANDSRGARISSQSSTSAVRCVQ